MVRLTGNISEFYLSVQRLVQCRENQLFVLDWANILKALSLCSVVQVCPDPR